MKKNLKVIFLIIIILVSIFIIYKNWSQKEEVIINEIQQLSLQNEELIVASSFETNVLNPSNAYVKFDVKYPLFKKASSDFNLGIENLVKAQMDDHLKISEENWQSRYDTQVKGDDIPKAPIKEEDKFSFFSDFMVVQSNSNYISFVLKYGGFSGGAHGYENYISFNYDLKNKKVIELKDLLVNDSQYLTTISTKSRVHLKKQFATVSEEDKKNSSSETLKEYVDNIVSMIESGTEPTEENFSIFTFTPEKVKIYFAQYQVGPYVIGIPEVEIDRK